MSSLAELMLQGTICSLCNYPFENAHGYPVACRDCFRSWKQVNRKGKRAFTQATGLQVACLKRAT